MTKSSPQTPLDRLAALATTEAAKRESARAANRARFPQLAEAADVLGAKLEWAKDAQGEIGSRKPIPGVVIDWTHTSWLETAAVYAKGRRK